jgi:ABC-2 type transport system ATP-binding protein
MNTIINTHALCKTLGNLRAVDGVTMQVSAGEIYGLVGPDGAGKTTMMRLLCGALRPTSGEIHIAGFSMDKQPEKGREQIGYLPQRFSLYEELTVLENIRFFAEVRGISAQDWRPRSLEILDFVGLTQFIERRVGRLSGGMKQKVGLAVALVHRPKILLLDEPTTGVDPVTRQDFWQLIIRLVAEEGVGVLVSTPYMDEASRCNRLGFILQGRLLVEGTPEMLRSQLDERVVALLGKPLPLLRQVAKADKDVEDVQMFGDRLHLRVRAGEADKVIKRLKKRIPAEGGTVYQLNPTPPELEDVFITLMESHA